MKEEWEGWREEEGGRMKEEGGRRDQEGGRREKDGERMHYKEGGGRRDEEGVEEDDTGGHAKAYPSVVEHAVLVCRCPNFAAEHCSEYSCCACVVQKQEHTVKEEVEAEEASVHEVVVGYEQMTSSWMLT